MVGGRDGHDDGVDLVEQITWIGIGRGLAEVGDMSSGLGMGIDDADKRDVAHEGKIASMVSAMMPDTDHPDASLRHAAFRPSLPRPFIPERVFSMN